MELVRQTPEELETQKEMILQMKWSLFLFLCPDKPWQHPIDVQFQNGQHLSQFEHGEIHCFNHVWTFGENVEKLPAELEVFPFNTKQYTDQRGWYRPFLGDHISYRYQIDAVIGEGGYGRILQCTDKGRFDEKKVAIKIKKQRQQYLYNETLILLQIHICDPENTYNCLHLLDFDMFRGHHYLVFDLYSMDLDTYIRRYPHTLTINKVAVMSKSILVALDFLRRCDIIHADVKPANILVDLNNVNQLKLGDFGLSVFVKDAKRYGLFQTRFWRAPESFCRGCPTTSMDMWSFALMLPEMLTGHHFLHGETSSDQFHLILQILGMPTENFFCDSLDSLRYFKKTTQIIKREEYYPRHCIPLRDLRTGKITYQVNRKLHRVPLRRQPPGATPLSAIFAHPGLAKLGNLMEQILKWDHGKRLRPWHALHHAFFTEASEYQDDFVNCAGAIAHLRSFKDQL